jgi:hypothetical protein
MWRQLAGKAFAGYGNAGTEVLGGLLGPLGDPATKKNLLRNRNSVLIRCCRGGGVNIIKSCCRGASQPSLPSALPKHHIDQMGGSARGRHVAMQPGYNLPRLRVTEGRELKSGPVPAPILDQTKSNSNNGI